MIYNAFIVLVALALLQFIFLKVVDSEVKQDYRDILNNGSRDSLKKTWHRQSFLKIAAIGTALVLPFTWLNWYLPVALLILEAAEFALLFDKRLNVARGLDPLYVGQNSGIDKFYRRLFANEPGRALMVTKIVTLCLGLLLMVYALYRFFSEFQ